MFPKISLQLRELKKTRDLYSIAAAGLVGVFVLMPADLPAPPVPVPNLDTPAFQSADLDPFFRSAASAGSESLWLATVNDGLTIVTADWEIEVDQEIEALVQDARDAAPAMTAQEEQELRDALIAQKQNAKAAWDASADLQIEREQEAYLQALVDEQLHELPVLLQSADASGLDAFLQEAATDAYSLSDWERIVGDGMLELSSAWEATALPILQQAASDQTDQALADGTITSSEGQALYEAKLLDRLSSEAVEIFRTALADRRRPELEAFLAGSGQEVNVDLNLPVFAPAEIAPYIAAAAGSGSEADWQSAVGNGRDYALDAWLVHANYEVNAIISALLGDSGLNGADAGIYADFLAEKLNIQMTAQGAAWSQAADAQIAVALQDYRANASALELNVPAFDVHAYGLIYDSASFAPTESAWESSVNAGRELARADWETLVAEEIDALLAAADADGMSPGQQIRYRADLENARDAALVQWNGAADAADSAQRQAFLINLLASLDAPAVPALSDFDQATLDAYIRTANDSTNSPSAWQAIVEDGIEAMFDAWRPGADAILTQAADDAVADAVAYGYFHSTGARELARTMLGRDMRNDAYDDYLNSALAYMADSFVAEADDVFSGLPVPALDAVVTSFDPNSMTAVFAGALTAADLYDWAVLVDNGKNAQRASFRTALLDHVQQVLNSAVAASGLSAADAAIYRTYLADSLAANVQNALQAWQTDANALVAERRREYLDSLAPVVARVNTSGARRIQIAPLATQAFSSAALLDLFEQARNATNAGQWNAIVLNGAQTMAAAWETQTSATVDNLVGQYTAGVSDDTFETITVDGVQAGRGVKVNSALAYRDYVRSFLEDQKRLKFAAWVKEAEAAIESGRESFLARLSAAAVAIQQEENAAAGSIADEQTDEANETAGYELRDSQNVEPRTREEQARDYLNRVRVRLHVEEQSWRSDWRDRHDTGVNQYNRSLALLEKNREQYMQTMQQADASWQTNLVMMEQFEGNVRNGLSTVTAQLQQMIAANPMFHEDASCDIERTTSCVRSPSSGRGVALNAAGRALQGRVNRLAATISSGAPLSRVVADIQRALEGMQDHAVERKAYWAERIDGDERWAQSFQWGEYQAPGGKGKYSGGLAKLDEVRARGALFEQNGVSAGALDGQILFRTTTYEDIETDFFGSGSVPRLQGRYLGDLRADPSTWNIPGGVDMGALLRHRQLALAIDGIRTGNSAGIEDYVTNATAEQRQVVVGSGTGDLCGSGTTTSASSESFVNECYSQAGDRAFMYQAQSGKHGGYTGWAPVRQVDLDLSYKWYDVNASANWRVWDEALATVQAVSNHWSREVLPDVLAWERQVADYRAGYAQWQTESAVQMQEYHQEYLRGRDQLLMGRNRFLYEMSEEWHDGRSQFDLAHETVDRLEVAWIRQVAEQRAAGEDIEADMVEELRLKLNAVVDAVDIEETAVPDVASEYEAVAATLPELEDEFVFQFEAAPDPALIAGVVADFQEATTGMLNFAILHATGDRLEAARQQYIERMREFLESIEPPEEQGELPEHPFTKYDVVVNDDGSVTGVRTIYDGTANQVDTGKGGYALQPENYAPNMMVQEIHLQAPEAGRLPDVGNLFQTNIGDMMAGVSQALERQSVELNDSSRMAIVESQLSEQMDIASRNVEQFFQDRQARIAWEQNAQEDDNSLMNTLTTVLSVVAPFCPPCGVALLAVNAVQGYQQGGLLGALTGLASSYISGFTAGLGMSVDLSYTYEGGFGGSLGMGVPGGGLQLSAGFGANAGQYGIGYSGGARGSLAGLNLGLNYSDEGGFGVSAGYSRGGIGGSLSYNSESGFGAGLSYNNGNFSAGLNYSEASGVSANLGLRYGASEQHDYINSTGQFGLNISGDGVGITNTASVELQAGGFFGWGELGADAQQVRRQVSGGSALGIHGTTTTGVFFGSDGEVRDIFDSSIRYSSEALRSNAANIRDRFARRLLSGGNERNLEFAFDEHGNRVKRLTLYLDGSSTADSQRYALCAGETGTDICELNEATGIYESRGMSVDQLTANLRAQYGDRFVVEHQGMNSFVNDSAHAGARISGGTVRDPADPNGGSFPTAWFHQGQLVLGVENTTGLNLLNAGSHLNGSDADGQGAAMADLLQSLYGSPAGVQQIHQVYAHSDGTIITATADEILSTRGRYTGDTGMAGILTNDNTLLMGSPLDNTVMNVLVGNGLHDWSSLTVRDINGNDPIAGAGSLLRDMGDHNWDIYFNRVIDQYNRAGFMGAVDPLVGLNFAVDANGDRVNRLAFQGQGADQLNGQMIDGEYVLGRYALCDGGADSTVVCERSTRTRRVAVGGGPGIAPTYMDVEEEIYVPTGQTLDEFVDELTARYGAQGFNVIKPGMNTDITSANSAASATHNGMTPGFRSSDGTITIAVENSSGVNVPRVVSGHLAGVDSGQGQMLADLVGTIDHRNLMGQMIGHSDGTSITAIADAILNDAGQASAMNNDNTFLYGSPLENSLMRYSANYIWGSNTAQFTSPLTNRYSHVLDPIPNSPQDGSFLQMDYHGLESVYVPVHHQYVIGQGLRGRHMIRGDLNDAGTAYFTAPRTQPREDYMAEYRRREEARREWRTRILLDAIRGPGLVF